MADANPAITTSRFSLAEAVAATPDADWGPVSPDGLVSGRTYSGAKITIVADEWGAEYNIVADLGLSSFGALRDIDHLKALIADVEDTER